MMRTKLGAFTRPRGVMAILKTFPGNIALAKLKGTVDVYRWKGLIVARAWPRHPHNPRTPLQQKTRSNLAETVKWQKTNPTGVNLAWKDMNSTPTYSSYHLNTSMGIRLIQKNAQIRPPDVKHIAVETNVPIGFTTVVIRVEEYDEFEPLKVSFIGGHFAPESVCMDYMIKDNAKIKDGVHVPDWVPDLRHFTEPTDITYSSQDQEYTIMYEDVGETWGFVSISLPANDPTIFLGPLLREGSGW